MSRNIIKKTKKAKGSVGVFPLALPEYRNRSQYQRDYQDDNRVGCPWCHCLGDLGDVLRETGLHALDI